MRRLYHAIGGVMLSRRSASPAGRSRPPESVTLDEMSRLGVLVCVILAAAACSRGPRAEAVRAAPARSLACTRNAARSRSSTEDIKGFMPGMTMAVHGRGRGAPRRGGNRATWSRPLWLSARSAPTCRHSPRPVTSQWTLRPRLWGPQCVRVTWSPMRRSSTRTAPRGHCRPCAVIVVAVTFIVHALSRFRTSAH